MPEEENLSFVNNSIILSIHGMQLFPFPRPFSLGIHSFAHPSVSLLPTWFIYNQQKWHISGVNGKSECPGRVKTKCHWLLLKGMHKDWLARNHDNVSVWSDMSTHGLLLQWTNIIQLQTIDINFSAHDGFLD
jgi:hypothetical protein